MIRKRVCEDILRWDSNIIRSDDVIGHKKYNEYDLVSYSAPYFTSSRVFINRDFTAGKTTQIAAN